MLQLSKTKSIAIDLYNIFPGKGGSGGGIWSYSFNLLKTLDKLLSEENSEQIKIYCFINSGIKLELENIIVVKIPYISRNIVFRMLWVHIFLPFLCLYYRIDVLHKLASEVPLVLCSSLVVTIHDLMNEYYRNKHITQKNSIYNIIHNLYFIFITKYATRYASKILVVSKSIKKEIQQIYHTKQDKIIVAYDGIDQSAKKSNSSFSQNENKILYIASFYPHKRHDLAIDAMGKFFKKYPQLCINTKLYIRGHIKDVTYYNSIVDRINRSENKVNYELLPYKAEDNLSDIYSSGKILLNLSDYEGFGLPVIEAQSMGIPVICSNIEVFEEITNGSAIIVKNDDSVKIADIMYKLLIDKLFFEQYSIAGKKNSEKYTWQSMAKIVLQTYKNCDKT